MADGTSPVVERVSDVIRDLARRFPGEAEFIAAWADSYARVIGDKSPKELTKLYFATIDGWAYKHPPRPADFAKRAEKPNHNSDGADLPAEVKAWRPGYSVRDPRHPRYGINSIIDETMRVYAHEIERLAGKFGRLTVASHLSFRLENRAVMGCRRTPPLSSIEITAHEWEAIERALTPAPPGSFPWEKGAGWRQPRGLGAGAALDRPANPAAEQRRVESIQRAERREAEEEWPF